MPESLLVTHSSWLRHRSVLLLVAVAFGLGQAVAARSAEPLTAPDKAHPQLAEKLGPLLQRYCLDCHSGKQAKGEIRFDQFRDPALLIRDRKLWEQALANIRGHVMPPDDKPQPTPQEREQFHALIDDVFRRHDEARRVPGRVTMRRLNRVEYNNTVRDLLGVSFRPADDFPSDDVGYGFDNIGDVLSLPPLLMEKYLAAAEQLATSAIVARENSVARTRHWPGKELDNTLNKQAGGSLYSNGEAFQQIEFERDGEYKFRIRAAAKRAGADPAHMELRVDKQMVRAFDVLTRDHVAESFEAQATVKAGKHRVAVAFTNDFYDENGGPDGKPIDRNLTVESLEIESPLPTRWEDMPESHRRIVFCQPQDSSPEPCARQIVERLASRAYRRPVTPEESQRLTALVLLAQKQGDSFERGVQLAAQAVLVSPHFLFRVETDQHPGPDGSYQLNDYELASRLSYFLWNSMPDDELFKVAFAGKLRQRDELTRQARRMIADPKSQSFVESFSSQWLQTRNLNIVNPATQVFPKFKPELLDAMRTETEMFFAAVMREDRSILDFIDADFSFVNDVLAEHYGIKEVSGREFRRVKLDNPNLGGVITQASMLTITSNPTRTSPVKRGKWILENILGTPPPPPPPEVPALTENRKVNESAPLRKRLEQHRANPACANCHQRMDPLGFGLENFDAIGQWREQDGKFPLDTAGVLPNGEQFNGPQELKRVLRGRRTEFTRCLSEKLLTYALGRGLEYTDKLAVNGIVRGVERQDFKFSALVAEIVSSEPFTRRSLAGAP
ncbi:MAG: DUF1592 domain-containing protein [Planctomycetes bacterium]|nr:DUF1592 domain-containing protein [Planctomycetota bacterium]